MATAGQLMQLALAWPSKPQQLVLSCDAATPIGAITGGRGSTATQPTHRELAPQHAAGKVPVPLGRECHWETKGQCLKLAVKLCVELLAWELATCSSTVMP